LISKKEDNYFEPKLPLIKSKNQELILDHEQILKIIQRGTKAKNRYKVIKELFQTYKKLTRSQIVEITGMNPGSASKELQSLCNTSFIKKITPTKSVKSHYFELNDIKVVT
jgi:predicted HTH transcriptional regulator